MRFHRSTNSNLICHHVGGFMRVPSCNPGPARAPISGGDDDDGGNDDPFNGEGILMTALQSQSLP